MNLWGWQIQLMGSPVKPPTAKQKAALNAKVADIAAAVRQSGGDEYAQLLKTYEYLQSYVKYDHEELRYISRGKCQNPHSHNAYGALVDGLAVCDGFSTAFALLTQKLGFSCLMVTGKAMHGGVGLIDHAWNIVKVQNKHYHMDVTWDANQFAEFGELSYDYFALTDDEIASDHDWDLNTTPACAANNLSFFLKNGLYAHNASQLGNIMRAASQNRAAPVRVKLSYNIVLPPEAGEYVAKLLLDEALKSGGAAQINYGWNEYIRCFTARFAK